MKISLAALFLLFSVTVFGQFGVTQKFQSITTINQAQQFIDANPMLQNQQIINLSASKDTSIIAKRLLRQKKGDIFSVGYVTYKVLESTDTVDYRANYIFLDGGEYTPQQLDSLKKLIVQQASRGRFIRIAFR